MSAQVVEADFTWVDGQFAPGLKVAVDSEGRIADVGPLDQLTTLRLAGQALLPGFVSAHSHAFQRGLRGKGERVPDGTGSFWTWRDAMYELVMQLDRPTFIALCTQTFQEMRDAGITTVGEFHYLHHTPGTDDHALDEAVLEAARAAGIRIVLLNAFYQTGSIGRPLGPAQQRFRTRSVAGYWTAMDALAAKLDPSRETLGAAVHSIRAAGLEEIVAVHAEAARRGMVLHMHVEEQAKEIEECLSAYGKTPMAVVTSLLADASDVTAVHCTHTTPDDLAAFTSAGGRVCLCPLTEANLGDGLPNLESALSREGRFSLGTDSNARIGMIEEMRWLEYGQRLRAQSRGVVADPDGGVAQRLLRAATLGGADALGIPSGTIEPGRWADFCTIDLTAPQLDGWEADTLLDSIVFGTTDHVVRSTCVGGHWRDSQHRRG